MGREFCAVLGAVVQLHDIRHRNGFQGPVAATVQQLMIYSGFSVARMTTMPLDFRYVSVCCCFVVLFIRHRPVFPSML